MRCAAASGPDRCSSVTAGRWELDSASAEFLELGSKKAEPSDGLEPVYPQKYATQSPPAHHPTQARAGLGGRAGTDAASLTAGVR